MRLTSALAMLVILCAPLPAAADDAPPWRHGTSLMGDLKYQPGFAHFDYANPDAPKGGMVRLSASGSFDNFNVVTGKGVLAAGIGNIYQSLMAPALDEPSSMYGEIADAISFPPD